MTLQWTFVAGVLYIELFLVSLLLLPFISPRTWQKVFRSRVSQMFSSYSNLYFNIFIAILVLLFLESIREVRKYSSDEATKEAKGTLGAETQLHMKLFRAQRNMYISGFALFLWIILRRLVLLISREATLMAETEASIQQARNASEVARQLMEEKDTVTDNLKNRDTEKKEESDESSDRGSSVAKYQEELEKTKEELYRAQLDLESMKKQAESTNQEYDRLLEEHSKLQKKLSVLGGSNTDDDKKGQ